MAVELDHRFTTDKPIDESFTAITDLERVVPAVEGGSVLERTGPDSVKAQILLKMGAMSMKMVGTIDVVEQDAEAHRVVMRVKAREAGGTAALRAHREGGVAGVEPVRARREQDDRAYIGPPLRQEQTAWP